jgi:hypothetical protein
MAATAPAKADAPAGKDGEGKPLVLAELVGPLEALPEPRPFAAQSLIEFSDLMKRVQVGLLTRDVEKEELADQDRCGAKEWGVGGAGAGAARAAAAAAASAAAPRRRVPQPFPCIAAATQAREPRAAAARMDARWQRDAPAPLTPFDRRSPRCPSPLPVPPAPQGCCSPTWPPTSRACARRR